MVMLNRRKRADKYGSPYCHLQLPAIAAGVTKIYEIDTDSELAGWLKYAPLDFLEITNNDDVDLQLTFDQQQKFYIPSGSIKAFDRKYWRRFEVKNLDAATTSTLGKVVIIVQKMALTQDEMLRRRL